MHSAFSSGIMIYCLIILLSIGSRVIQGPDLEDRIKTLRLMLILLVPGLIALTIDLIILGSAVPRTRLPLPEGGTVPAEWYTSVRELGQQHTATLCFFAFLVIGLAIPAIFVLRDLRAFAMTHRVDLAARDQATLARSTQDTTEKPLVVD